jgi:hypothetical protein
VNDKPKEKSWVKGKGPFSRLNKKAKTLRLSWASGERRKKLEKVSLFLVGFLIPTSRRSRRARTARRFGLLRAHAGFNFRFCIGECEARWHCLLVLVARACSIQRRRKILLRTASTCRHVRVCFFSVIRSSRAVALVYRQKMFVIMRSGWRLSGV